MLFNLLVSIAGLVCICRNAFAVDYTPTVFAGTGTQGWSGDNGPATSAQLNFVSSCWIDSNADTFIVDYSTNVVRKVDPSGIITTIGGTGSSGIANAGGAFTSVPLYSPWGVNGYGNYLYISDNYHVWKYDRGSGQVAILAGTGSQGISGDGGPSTSAQINKANGLWITPDGTLYIAEYGNNLVRKITSSNIINSVVGGGGVGFGGDGGPAVSTNVKLNAPQGVYVDTNGILFVSDRNNVRIRYVVNGILNTYAGGGPSGNTADGYTATNFCFSSPFDVKGDSLGNIFVVEGANKLRVVDYSTKIVSTWVGTGVSAPRGMWLDFTTTGKACVGMLAYVKTVPLYVNPTAATDSPSAPPTLSPTTAPSTGIPTAIPSFQPTMNPTVIPTAVPSTTTPTTSPTNSPTAMPSTSPTRNPTTSPSFLPTASPSQVPTASPTASPTFQPSANPTKSPTASPTTTPSFQPSAVPTYTPTVVPSFIPTNAPSAIPTYSPSEIPTASPTFQPTAKPTMTPTAEPTFAPSPTPTEFPTSLPSAMPTAPTAIPTAVPTFSPTAVNPDVVNVDVTTRVKFVDGNRLNALSLSTLITALHNISGNSQSTTITSTTLVSSGGSSGNNYVRRYLATIIIQGSYTYDIGFRNTYVMAYHPGYNSTQLSSLKAYAIQQNIQLGSFEANLRNLAMMNNATQLLNSTCNEVTKIQSTVITPSSGSSSLKSDGYSAGIVVGIVLGSVSGFILLSCVLYLGIKNRRKDEEEAEKKRRAPSPSAVAPTDGKVTHYYREVKL